MIPLETGNVLDFETRHVFVANVLPLSLADAENSCCRNRTPRQVPGKFTLPSSSNGPGLVKNSPRAFLAYRVCFESEFQSKTLDSVEDTRVGFQPAGLEQGKPCWSQKLGRTRGKSRERFFPPPSLESRGRCASVGQRAISL